MHSRYGRIESESYFGSKMINKKLNSNIVQAEPFLLPSLFYSADAASNNNQKFYFCLIIAEYIFLFASACLTIFKSESRDFIALNALVFLAALSALLVRAYFKPEQAWYKCRALAESVKTLSWRFSMRAAPYDDELVGDAKTDFRNNLSKLLATNSQLGNSLANFNQGGPQVTVSMVALRGAEINQRKALYLKYRVNDQRDWYQKKSRQNACSARGWMILAIAAYAISIGFVLAPLHTPEFINLPVGPLIVIASAVLGWMQIKKFNELASIYALTVQEIGIAEGLIEDAADEVAFSKAINEVELVFSREHTQWLARKSA